MRLVRGVAPLVSLATLRGRGARALSAAAAARTTRKSVPAQAQGVYEPLGRAAACERPSVRVLDLTASPVDYEEAAALMQELLAANIDGGGDAVILVEHPAVYTLGRGATLEHVLFDADAPGAPKLVRAERGGDVTYHGPGQLVAYPILNLRDYKRDSHWYLRALEETIVRTCAALGAPRACRSDEHTGVWLDGAKISAVGVALRKWVTYHGISLNLAPNMSHYDGIVPCGLDPTVEPVGALNAHLGRDLDAHDVAPVFLDHFQQVFECQLKLDAAALASLSDRRARTTPPRASGDS